MSQTKQKRKGETAARIIKILAAGLGIALISWIVIQVVSASGEALKSSTNPQDFLPSMIYMLYNKRSLFWYGIRTTVLIALIGTAIAFVLACLMVMVRIQKPERRDNAVVVLLKNFGSRLASIYITVIRGTPMMVQALIFYYVGFGLFKNSGMSISEINKVWSFFVSGLITVSLNSTAYLAEVLRGGIEAVDIGQTEAARSLGMTKWQTMLKVVFPQAVKHSIPSIGNEFIINIKDSSVLSVIGCYDLMYATTSVAGIYYKSLPVYCIAAVVYLILTYLSSLLMKYLARKLDTAEVSLPSQN